MKNLFHNIYFFVLFLFFNAVGYAQLYPVQLTPIFNSPYSVKISDYATSMDTKMQLLINPTDISISQRRVRLKLYIQGNGLNIQTSDYTIEQRPIYINGGELQTLTNVDIASLFRLENLQGISVAQYANPLPEGMYNFCFELYDFVTNQKISQKSCANLYLILNDPPLLNTPQKNEQIASTEFPNILFTWTPRQINATNISYKFELKQLLDPTLDPQIGFQMSPTLYEETLFGTAVLYNLSMPILTPGLRYAWRVRAISTTGLSENAVFKNDGYSEIYSFKYTASCAAPTFLLSESQNSKSVKITWEGVPEHTRYQVQYKKQGVRNAQWFSSNSLNRQSLITNLEPGVTYEFRVGSSCDPAEDGVQSFTYSNTSTFITPTETSGVPAYNCGIVPQINIQNQKPLTNLIQSETFKAGDFPVTILELQGENSPYSGRGYIIVPYLADTKIAVEFKDIVINTDYQLINGVVETSYNPDWKNVTDIEDFTGEGQGGQIEETVPFIIKDIVINANGDIVVNGVDGEQITIPGGKDIVITDSKGNIYTVDKDGNGSNEPAIAALGGKPTPENTDGVDKSGQATAFTAKGITIAFSGNGSKYAFDVMPENASAALKKMYAKAGDNVLSYKAVLNGDSDTVLATVKLTDESIKLDSIVFKTQNGAKIDFKRTDKVFVLTVKGNLSYAEEQILATVKQGKKWQVIGAFVLVHISPKDVNVALVPTDDISANKINDIITETQKIYSKVGVKINFKKEQKLEGFERVVPESVEVIQTEKNTLTSTYSAQQQAINDLYKGGSGSYVLFVTNKEASRGQQGYMRLNGQFGYVFNSSLAKTPAHELGHGIFKLEHPFEQYKTTDSSTDFLMDYSSGSVLNHMDWKQINDPAFKLYAFQSQSSGEFANYVITPDYRIVSLPSPSSLIYDACNFDNEKKGPVYGFSENGKVYCWGKDAYYERGTTTKYPGKLDYIENPKDSDKITLFFDIERPCPSKEMTITYSQIKDKLNISDLNKFIQNNADKAKNVPCGNSKDAFTSSFFDITSLDVPPGVKVDMIEGGKFSLEQIQKTISQVNKLILKNNSGYGYNTEMTNGDLGNISVDENIPAGGDILNRLDHRLVYLSEFSKQKNNPVNIYVVYTKVDYLINGNWNEYAKQVYEASNLKDKNAILITVPYFNLKKGTLYVDYSVDHFMPGVYAKGVDIKTDAIVKVKANNTSRGDTGAAGTYQSILNSQVEEFIGQVYQQTYKPFIVYLGLKYADGNIQATKKESSEYTPGYNFVKTVLLQQNKYYDEIQKLVKPGTQSAGISSTGIPVTVYNPYLEQHLLEYELEKAELLDKANEGNIKDWNFVENSVDFKEKQLDELTANKYITGYAYKGGFTQWTKDLTVVFGGTDEKPPIYEFADVYNKDKWSTLDPIVYGVIDAASVAASFVAADAIPEAVGLMYSVKRKDVVSATLYTTAIVIPALASGELRVGQKLASKLAKDSKIFFRGFVYTLQADGKLVKFSTNYKRGRLLEFFNLSDKSVTTAELDAFADAFKNKKIGFSKIKEILNESDEIVRASRLKGTVLISKVKGDIANFYEAVLKGGYKTEIVGDIIKVYTKSSTDVLAEISENSIRFKYNGWGKDIITNSDKTTTCIAKFDDLLDGPGSKWIKYDLPEGGFGRGKINNGGINILDVDDATYNGLEIIAEENLKKLGKTSPTKAEIISEANEIFWNKYNLPFLEEAFSRGDDIRLLTEPQTLFSSSGFYQREIEVITIGWKKPDGTFIQPLKTKYNYKFNDITKSYEKIK